MWRGMSTALINIEQMNTIETYDCGYKRETSERPSDCGLKSANSSDGLTVKVSIEVQPNLSQTREHQPQIDNRRSHAKE